MTAFTLRVITPDLDLIKPNFPSVNTPLIGSALYQRFIKLHKLKAYNPKIQKILQLIEQAAYFTFMFQ